MGFDWIFRKYLKGILNIEYWMLNIEVGEGKRMLNFEYWMLNIEWKKEKRILNIEY